MSESTKTPALFWVISVAALLWNAMGVMAYIMMTKLTPEATAAQYGQAFADIFASKPAWATGSFAVAVFGGLLGSIALLLRKKWAKPLFILSLLGVIIHDIWGVMAGTLSVVTTFDKGMTIAVLVISVFLVWFAKKKTAKGILT